MSALETPVEGLSLTLSSVLDLRAASALKDTLQQGLGQGVALAIDASSVARMSTACVQVITAFVLSAQRAGVRLTLKSSSTAFDAAFTNLGLVDILKTFKSQESP
jgi:chemotaxis protein CheX